MTTVAMNQTRCNICRFRSPHWCSTCPGASTLDEVKPWDGVKLFPPTLASKPKPVAVCEACNGKGWWCRCCGGLFKRAGLKTILTDPREIDSIIEIQFGGGDEPLVPCYVCNRNGRKPLDGD